MLTLLIPGLLLVLLALLNSRLHQSEKDEVAILEEVLSCTVRHALIQLAKKTKFNPKFILPPEKSNKITAVCLKKKKNIMKL